MLFDFGSIVRYFLRFDFIIKNFARFMFRCCFIACVVHVADFLLIRFVNNIFKQNKMLKLKFPFILVQ